jgi:hypothetical protein
MHPAMIVGELAAESGEHRAGAAGVVPPDQVGGEIVEPVGWIVQCRSKIGCSHEDPVR